LPNHATTAHVHVQVTPSDVLTAGGRHDEDKTQSITRKVTHVARGVGQEPPNGQSVSRCRCCRIRVPSHRSATGLTFSKIALETKDESKIVRNRANARKAYDAVLHFAPGTSLSAEEAQQIDASMALLKSALQQLGEDL